MGMAMPTSKAAMWRLPADARPAALERIRTWCQLAGAIGSGHLPGWWRLDEVAGTPILSCEFVGGVPLPRLEPEAALATLADAVRGLQALTAAGLSVGRVEPGSVRLVEGRGGVVVAAPLHLLDAAQNTAPPQDSCQILRETAHLLGARLASLAHLDPEILAALDHWVQGAPSFGEATGSDASSYLQAFFELARPEVARG